MVVDVNQCFRTTRFSKYSNFFCVLRNGPAFPPHVFRRPDRTRLPDSANSARLGIAYLKMELPFDNGGLDITIFIRKEIKTQ
jgi:hypothetical protein